ncbi:MAG: hypothetical protein HYS52_02005 [Candidatus Wildermuthbacteria bacterium]|nr:hypothetical protein [Candidatus Wildermuthbacteria bacterium]
MPNVGLQKRSGQEETSLSMKVLTKIGEFFEEVALPILIWDFDKLSEASGIRSLYFNNSASYSKHIYELKRRKYLQEVQTKSGKAIKLTPKGRIQILKYRLKSKNKELEWDGKWRAISWDVPEISRRDRDYLRGLLRWIGFLEMHKSFWIFPYDIREELKELVKLYKKDLAGDIRFLTIEEIEDDGDITEKFGIYLRS